MTKRGRAVAWIAGALVAGFVASAVAAVPGGAQSGPAAGHFRAAERVAEVVTLATGVPISPLLGVSGFGAYRWWTTPAPARPALPWYARPWYWGTGLALALLFAVNTTLGAMVPGLSKPMDFVEQYENQVSAVLASPVVLFEVFRIVDSLPGFASAGEALPAGALAASGVAAVAALPAAVVWLAKLGTAALVLLAFAVVFLAFHTIQVLIALSPSNLLDILLRLFRLSMLSLTAMAASVHPYVGAAFGLLVLLAASLVAGWAFRLTVFGWVVAGDIVRQRRAGESAPLAAFAGRGLAGPAPRSYGRIELDAAGGRRFAWRPWLVLPERSAALGGEVAVRRGALSPVLIAMGGVREPVLARFPPRFQGGEEALGRRLGATRIVDGRLVRGMKAAWAWLRDTVRGDGAAAELTG
ncbi:MAG TPA: hypothetical protein VGC00_13015 [Thermoanaerobaculia bacterium]